MADKGLVIDFKLCSNNVRGLNDRKKRSKYFTWLSENKLDIACLQETFCTANNQSEFNKNWEGQSYHSLSDSPHSRGVAILINDKLHISKVKCYNDNYGRILVMNFELQGLSYTICSIYAPNKLKDRLEFLETTRKFINDKKTINSNVIICGDMNTVLDRDDRSAKGSDTGTLRLKKMIENFSLRDAHVLNNSMYGDNDKGHTYINPGNANVKSRIDYILLDDNLCAYMNAFKLRISPAPDHKCIEIHLRNNNNRGKSIWKLNTAILHEEPYKKAINDMIISTLSCKTLTSLTKREKWDLCKIKIKEFSIKYCKIRSATKKNELHLLETEINNIDQLIINNNDDDFLLNRRSELKNKLDALLTEKTIGYQIRSKSKWIEEGEKNTPYFLNLEKNRQSQSVIKKLQKSDGSFAESQADLFKEMSKFYKTLYMSKKVDSTDINNYIANLPRKMSLTESDSKLCDGYVTTKECETALNKMKDKKSPGSDGLPAEFYRTFWPVIKQYLAEIYNESLDALQLSDSQNMAILTLIYKKDNPCLLKNYRPISLTNTDYKILAHILATRLHKVLATIISEDQNGYVKSRLIGYNIRLVEDIFQYNNKNNISSYIGQLDFEKAFDTIERNFLFLALKHFNFGDSFINWIKTLYNNSKIMIKNNGWISSAIDISRGVRQGCPISALLFIIAVELLADKIRVNNKICGINLGNVCNTAIATEVKLLQYADDMIVMGTNEDSINEVFREVEKFTGVAGPKLNINKSEILLTGIFKSSNTFGNCAVKTVINCLGIYIGHDNDLCNQKNWHEKLDNIQSVLNQWKRRNLTMLGKIIVMKSLAISKITYSVTNTAEIDNFIQKLNKILYTYLWDKKERIKRNTLIGKIEWGGIEMLDIQSHFIAIKTV